MRIGTIAGSSLGRRSLFPLVGVWSYGRRRGAWVCSFFRNESPCLSSGLIVEAVAATRAYWEPPELGMVTFIDTAAVRRKRDWGRCYVRAGWTRLRQRTQSGLVVLQCVPQDMPAAEPAYGQQLAWW